jgi:hypothetical protein
MICSQLEILNLANEHFICAAMNNLKQIIDKQVLTAKGLNETREARCQILDNNSLTANGWQSEIWHLVSDVFLRKTRNTTIGLEDGGFLFKKLSNNQKF